MTRGVSFWMIICGKSFSYRLISKCNKSTVSWILNHSNIQISYSLQCYDSKVLISIQFGYGTVLLNLKFTSNFKSLPKICILDVDQINWSQCLKAFQCYLQSLAVSVDIHRRLSSTFLLHSLIIFLLRLWISTFNIQILSEFEYLYNRVC